MWVDTTRERTLFPTTTLHIAYTMNTTITLSAADATSIRRLLDTGNPRSGIPPNARPGIERLLSTSRISEDDAILENHVGLHDPVTLVNPNDSSDWYRMEIVEPAEVDLDRDRISLCHPMCLAILGARLDEEVEWDTGHSLRRMRIASVVKAALATV
jgi:transcription elongation GreA/GreB family factor